jgi:excisionase family DNA binding protein
MKRVVAGVSARHEQLRQMTRQPSLSVPAPLYLTLEEAAQFTGLLAPHLLARLKDGRLPATREGRHWKLRKTDLEKL